MNELGWLLLMDLAGCVLVTLLLTALTGSRRSGDAPRGRHADHSARPSFLPRRA